MDGYQHNPNDPYVPRPNGRQGHADEMANRQARLERLEYLRGLQPQRKPLWLRVSMFTLAGVLLGCAVAAASWKLLNSRKGPTPAKVGQPASGQTGPNDNFQNVPTKQYKSTALNLSFDYPENWKVAESGKDKLTATSPPTTLTNASGGNINGQIIMTISPKGQNLKPFDAGNAAAVRDSEKIKYTRPSNTQRKETSLTFTQYANTKISGVLDALYVTGDNEYSKDQPIPKTDMVNLDPLISVTFNKCTDSACNNTQPTNIKADMWNKNSFADPIRKMLESLQVSQELHLSSFWE